METDPGDGLLVFGPDGLPNATDAGATVAISDLNFLWNAGDRLRALNNESTREQRNYDSLVPTGNATTQASRYVFTYIDEDLDGEIDAGEQMPFTTDAIDASNFGFFGVGSEAAADAIVDYIRGFEDPDIGFRNRTLVAPDGTETVYRLGDLVNSRPLVVERPQAAYDTRFDDESYEEFFNQYRNRRNMVYVGGNDGLLHAFNGGFTRNIEEDQAGYVVTGGDGNHPLGAEVWAYAPYNLLPHLQWLTNNFYSHVYYVDGSPQAFDVKIFNDDAKHPGGWGTILVVGMRQGGGDFPVNQGGISTTTRSAYVVLDITDPEDPPELLAEITHPDLNMTTSQPDIFYDCELTCNQPDLNQNDNFDGEWKLIFGSGPADLQDFTTNETAKVFAYNLETGDLEVEEVEVTTGSVSEPVPNSFVGSVATADWDNGKLGFRNDDVVYYGLVGTREDTSTADPDDVIETGGIYRYFPGDLPAGTTRRTSLFLDTDRPMFQKPTLASRENLGNDVLGSWVFAGTGIYLTRDNEETSSQERFYGLLETANRTEINNLNNVIRPTGTGNEEDSRFLTYETVTENDLIDVSDIGVLRIVDQPRETRPLVNPPTTSVGTLTTTGALATYIAEFTQGWFIDIPIATVAGDPSGRITDSATVFIDQLLFVTFTPGILTGENICAESQGTAELFIVDQSTGVPVVGTLGASPLPTGGATPENARSTNVGTAPVKSPIISSSETQGPNSGTIILQRGDGSIITDGDTELQGAAVDAVPTIRAGWRELNQIQ